MAEVEVKRGEEEGEGAGEGEGEGEGEEPLVVSVGETPPPLLALRSLRLEKNTLKFLHCLAGSLWEGFARERPSFAGVLPSSGTSGSRDLGESLQSSGIDTPLMLSCNGEPTKEKSLYTLGVPKSGAGESIAGCPVKLASKLEMSVASLMVGTNKEPSGFTSSAKLSQSIEWKNSCLRIFCIPIVPVPNLFPGVFDSKPAMKERAWRDIVFGNFNCPFTMLSIIFLRLLAAKGVFPTNIS